MRFVRKLCGRTARSSTLPAKENEYAEEKEESVLAPQLGSEAGKCLPRAAAP